MASPYILPLPSKFPCLTITMFRVVVILAVVNIIFACENRDETIVKLKRCQNVLIGGGACDKLPSVKACLRQIATVQICDGDIKATDYKLEDMKVCEGKVASTTRAPSSDEQTSPPASDMSSSSSSASEGVSTITVGVESNSTGTAANSEPSTAPSSSSGASANSSGSASCSASLDSSSVTAPHPAVITSNEPTQSENQTTLDSTFSESTNGTTPPSLNTTIQSISTLNNESSTSSPNATASSELTTAVATEPLSGAPSNEGITVTTVGMASDRSSAQFPILSPQLLQGSSALPNNSGIASDMSTLSASAVPESTSSTVTSANTSVAHSDASKSADVSSQTANSAVTTGNDQNSTSTTLQQPNVTKDGNVSESSVTENVDFNRNSVFKVRAKVHDIVQCTSDYTSATQNCESFHTFINCALALLDDAKDSVLAESLLTVFYAHIPDEAMNKCNNERLLVLDSWKRFSHFNGFVKSFISGYL